jgi:hypothetical protein
VKRTRSFVSAALVAVAAVAFGATPHVHWVSHRANDAELLHRADEAYKCFDDTSLSAFRELGGRLYTVKEGSLVRLEGFQFEPASVE